MQSTTVLVGGKGSNKKTSLYVGGLEETVTEEILHAAFLPFGDIKDLNIPVDVATGKHRGFGFIEYLEAEDAAAAIDNMHNSELYGKVLRVNIAKPMAIKGGEKGFSHLPVWADADTWLERQAQEKEMKGWAKADREREVLAGGGGIPQRQAPGGGDAESDGEDAGDNPMAALEADAEGQ